MKTYSTLRSVVLPLCALAALASSNVFAQTTPPTPQSVAPAYTPPKSSYNSGTQTAYQYKAPHANTWDFYLTVGYCFWDNITVNASNVNVGRSAYGKDGKIKMDLDDSFTFGFGVGYNITEQLSAHALFTFANPDYDGKFSSNDGKVYRINSDADIFCGDLAIRYDLTRGKIRPYIQGSVGFMYLDTGVVNGNYYNNYDPYYGYYYYPPTVNHTYLELGATGGLRWDFNRHIFGQLSYTASFVSANSSWMVNHNIDVSVGWNY